jgi:hypothetical protein
MFATLDQFHYDDAILHHDRRNVVVLTVACVWLKRVLFRMRSVRAFFLDLSQLLYDERAVAPIKTRNGSDGFMPHADFFDTEGCFRAVVCLYICVFIYSCMLVWLVMITLFRSL